MSHPRREKPGPGQESVWDYPRPPRIELSERHIEIVFGGIKIADSRSARRVLETSHPPVYYIPEKDIRMECLSRAKGSSMCEWKGIAVYYDVVAADRTAARAAWSYPDPTPAFESLRDCIAFYPALMDECYVDGERARPQPGGFYGGWITRDIVGPFKGGPGTSYW
jgi:uncharacterized protein (DUF427 family)